MIEVSKDMHSLARIAFDSNEKIEVGFTVGGVTHKGLFFIDGVSQSFGAGDKEFEVGAVFVRETGAGGADEWKPEKPDDVTIQFSAESEFESKPTKEKSSWERLRESGESIDKSAQSEEIDGDVHIEVINRTKHVVMVDKKFAPETEREKMLVEAVLRMCRGQSLECQYDGCDWESAEAYEGVNINNSYRVPPTKAESILEEVTNNMDESAAAVVMEAMRYSPTLKGLCDE